MAAVLWQTSCLTAAGKQVARSELKASSSSAVWSAASPLLWRHHVGLAPLLHCSSHRRQQTAAASSKAAGFVVAVQDDQPTESAGSMQNRQTLQRNARSTSFQAHIATVTSNRLMQPTQMCTLSCAPAVHCGHAARSASQPAHCSQRTARQPRTLCRPAQAAAAPPELRAQHWRLCTGSFAR